MKKKILLVTLVFLLAAAVVVSLRDSKSAEECAFCQEEVLQRQAFYEDDFVVALYSHKPIIPGHVLIIPKRHVERFEELEDAELLRIKEVMIKVHQAAQKIYEAKDYLILQKNGKAAGQSVPHVHFHYFPRKEKQQSEPLLLLRFLIIPHLSPISNEEMAEAIKPFKIQFAGL